jgi:hypothetical protein
VLRVFDTRYVAQAPGGGRAGLAIDADRYLAAKSSPSLDHSLKHLCCGGSANVSWTPRILSNSMKVGCSADKSSASDCDGSPIRNARFMNQKLELK